MIKKHLGLFVTLLAASVFIVGFYHHVLFQPNSFLFSSSGDGIKNYFTYAYYINKNDGLVEFTGMNYPYSEHFLYTDCHPLLAIVLKGVVSIFPFLGNYVIGVVNLIMIFSLLVTAVLVYLLLKELRVNRLLASLGAMGIMALSPQILRVTGHYALSYSFLIPLTLYLVVLSEKRKDEWKWLFLLAISNLVWFFTHAYLGMISTTMVFAYYVVSIVLDKTYRQQFGRFALSLVLVFLPMLVFYGFTKLTDFHQGRTTNPWGIYENHATWASVFLPMEQTTAYLTQLVAPHAKQPWEGRAYIGLVAYIGVVFFFISAIRSLFKGAKGWAQHHLLSFKLMLAAFVVLLYSMFIPFAWGLDWMLDYVSIVKQFRALGRFAWVFFFVANIVALVYLGRFIDKLWARKQNAFALLLVLVLPSVMLYESLGQHKSIAQQISVQPNYFNAKNLDASFQNALSLVDPSEYQAIIALPFFYIGSENYGVSGNAQSYRPAMLLSYHLKLPLANAFLTRTGIEESKNIMQLLAPSVYEKKIKLDMPEERPFLIMHYHSTLNEHEQALLDKATLVADAQEFSLYEISFDQLFANESSEELVLFYLQKDKLRRKNGFLVSDTSKFFSYTGYTNLPCDHHYASQGAYSAPISGFNTLATFGKGELPINTKLILRFWVYNQGANFGQDQMSGICFVQQKLGEQVQWLDPIVSPQQSVVINGDWSMVEIPFEAISNEAEYQVLFKGTDKLKNTLIVDDLLIYENGLLIYSDTDNYLLKNNHLISKQITDNPL